MIYKVALPQPYLRKHILNFEKGLKQFTFVKKANLKSQATFYADLPDFEKEVQRTKVTWTCRARRLLGVPNLRIRYERDCDLTFTYGCLLLSNKPYCVYIENGLALYNYDLGIAKNPLARTLVSFAIRRKNCKKLIFMSETAQKSFLVSAQYSPGTLKHIREKSAQVYPYLEKNREITHEKKSSGSLNLLFSGMFYMKGGVELVSAFTKLQKKYLYITLTLVAPLQTIKADHVKQMNSTPGVTLLDANLTLEEMNNLYKKSDIFVLPTYRDSYGLVIQEALSWGMPIITTDQYAIGEMVKDSYNGFIFPRHPLKDYREESFKFLGKYYNPKDFYTDLFRAQKDCQLQEVEDFVYTSIEKFILDPSLLEKYSQNSVDFYNKKFHPDILSCQIESIFLEAVKK